MLPLLTLTARCILLIIFLPPQVCTVLCVQDVEGAAAQCKPQRAFSMRLQRVPSSELVEFPENEEGHLGKVRWYSFIFLLQVAAPVFPCIPCCGISTLHLHRHVRTTKELRLT